LLQTGYALPVDSLINLLGAKCRLVYPEGLLEVRKFKSYNTLHHF